MPEISLNQLAEFSESTPAVRKRIVNQQIKIDKRLVPWYQRAKSAIRKYLENVNDYTPIEEGIAILRQKIPASDRQKNDQKVSIEALQRVSSLKVPGILKRLKYELLRPDIKSIRIEGVDVI